MPFIPHTKQDIDEMLAAIGVANMEELFAEIPSDLRRVSLANIPSGISEMELTREMRARALSDAGMMCFIGAGAYEHHIPAAVWEIAMRGEFYTAYTPYQAEASQGSLQLIYEYQTMMTSLMALDVSNASLYDGATALAEAILMAIRLDNKKQRTSVLLPRTIHPYYRDTVRTIVSQQAICLCEVAYDKTTGKVTHETLNAACHDDVAVLVIPQPNFFGVLEDVDELVNWAAERNILTIAVVNPLASALLKPPGQWGVSGVDIACGDGQPLGIPLAGGGPYYGFLCAKKSHARQMPGRIVGRTIDADGKTGYVLTMQAREQHIRRAKATSNICTNQGLMVTASTIYMSLMGPSGLRQIAVNCHQRMRELAGLLCDIPSLSLPFMGPYFHELVVDLNQPVEPVLRELARRGIQGGYALAATYKEWQTGLLICVTETKTTADIQLLVQHLKEILM